MKTVEFNGQKFDVPEWGRFLTMDDFGDVEVWNNPPKKDGKYYIPVYPPSTMNTWIGNIKQMDKYKEIV
jgi:hypothetical protein